MRLRTRALLALLLVAHGLSPWFLPIKTRLYWWWLADPLGTQPWVLQTGLAFLLAILLLNDLLARPERWIETFAERLRSLWWERPWVTSAVYAGAAGLSLWACRSIHLQWGDGDLVASRYQYNTSIWSDYAPLSTWFKTFICELFADTWWIEIPARLQFESVCVGAITATFLLWFCLWAWGSEEGVWWWLIGCGSMSTLLWFGHIEIYTMSWSFALVAVTVCIAYLESLDETADTRRTRVRIPLWAPCLTISLAVAAAAWCALYLPALLYLLWSTRRTTGSLVGPMKKHPAMRWILPALGLAIPVLLVCWLVPPIGVVKAAFNRLLFFSRGGGEAVPWGRLFNDRLLLGKVQTLCMVGTPGVFALLIALAGGWQDLTRANPWSVATRWFVPTLVLPSVLFVFWWYPELGLPWDWDLYTFAGPATALGLTWFAVRRRSVENRRARLRAIAFASHCLVIPFLLSNNLLLDRTVPGFLRHHIWVMDRYDPSESYELAAILRTNPLAGEGPPAHFNEEFLMRAQAVEPSGGRVTAVFVDAQLDPLTQGRLVLLDVWGDIWRWENHRFKRIVEDRAANPNAPPSRTGPKAMALAMDSDGDAIRLWEDRFADRLRLNLDDADRPSYTTVARYGIPKTMIPRIDGAPPRTHSVDWFTHLSLSFLPSHRRDRTLDVVHTFHPERFIVLDDSGVLYDLETAERLATVPQHPKSMSLIADATYVGVLRLTGEVTWVFGKKPAATSTWPYWAFPNLRDVVLVREGRGAFHLDFIGGAHAVGEVPLMGRWYTHMPTVRFGRILVTPDESLMYEVDVLGRVFVIGPAPPKEDIPQPAG